MLYGYLQNPEQEMLEFRKSPIALTLMVLMFFGFAIYFWIKYFDKKTKLIIDRDGIWTKKTDIIPWKDIWYLFFKETRGKWKSLELKIKLRNSETEYSIDLSAMDQTEQDILDALRYNSQGFPIQILEREVVK